MVLKLRVCHRYVGENAYMKVKNIDFPDELIDSLENRKLVIFAGAGVSKGKPSDLPCFKGLANKIAEGTGEPPLSENSQGRPDPDIFLGTLHDKQVEVHKRAAKLLKGDGIQPNELHKNLLRLYVTPKEVRLVTTNYDLLFEKAAQDLFKGNKIESYVVPALPSGQNFRGIVHIHGSVNDPDNMVLTDKDFGRVYLTEGWTRNFLIDMFSHFDVLFVGYSYDDIIMKYLTLALSETELKQTFILVDSGNNNLSQRKRLGMSVIFYPKSENHAELHKGIQSFSDIVNWGPLDWEKEIEKIVKNRPPSDKHQIDIVKKALKNKIYIKFFTKTALLPEWIDWLDKNNYPDNLFKHGDHTLNDLDRELVEWLARFVHHDDSKRLFSLISRHSNHRTILHQDFLRELGKEVGNIAPEPSNQEVISQWISLLLTTTPLNTVIGQCVLNRISKPCIKQNMVEELLQIFGAMTKSMFDQKHPCQLPFVGMSSDLNEVWKKGLKPNLEQIAEPLLMLTTKRLRERYLMRQTWSPASRMRDIDNIERSEIELQDKHDDQETDQKEVNVLIDAARDSLEWLAINKVDAVYYWSNYLSTEKVPLLRRLAVHGISKNKKLTSNGKIDWLLKHIDLHHDYPFNNNKEIAEMVKKVYPESDEQHRGRLIRSVLDYDYPMLNESVNLDKKEWLVFGWLSLFREAAPDCLLVQKEREKLLKQHPMLSEQHSDFLEQHRPRALITVRDVEWESPWSTKDLLSKPPADWLQELLSSKSSDTSFNS